MLLIVSTNPTIDRTIGVPILKPHQVHRCSELHLSAGGKGINVSRACRALGAENRLTGFIGGFAGQQLKGLVEKEGLEAIWYEAPGCETKMSHLLKHADGDTTVINEPGPYLPPQDRRNLHDLIISQAYGTQAAVLAGSIPPGMTVDEYVTLCRQLEQITGNVFIDTPGSTLEAIVANPQGFSIKVNREELSEAMKCDLSSANRLNAAMRSLIGAGARLVCITLGHDGCVAASPKGAWSCAGSPVETVSSVGSGDSFTAGLVHGCLQGQSLPEALRLAAAAGAANAETPLPAVFKRSRVEELLPLINVETI